MRGTWPAAGHMHEMLVRQGISCACACPHGSARAKPAHVQSQATVQQYAAQQLRVHLHYITHLRAVRTCEAELPSTLAVHTSCKHAHKQPVLRHTTHRLATSRLLQGFGLKPALQAQAQVISHILARTTGVKGETLPVALRAASSTGRRAPCGTHTAAATGGPAVHKCRSKNINHAGATQQKHATLHTVVDCCVHVKVACVAQRVCKQHRGIAKDGWGITRH